MKPFYLRNSFFVALLTLGVLVNAQVEDYNPNPEFAEWQQRRMEPMVADDHGLGWIPHPLLNDTELPDYVKARLTSREAAPSSFDWRSSGGVTSVKDQGSCPA